MLYRNLRLAQIFGANTESGKTVLTTALCRTAASTGENVSYLKPVGTGNLEEGGDDGHVAKFARIKDKGTLETKCLFRFQTPVSPHLAIQRDSPGAQPEPPTNEVFAGAISDYLSDQAAGGHTQALYVETAGGVHSPTLNGTSQADAFRPLRLPTILIASPALGGISTTISAYESLLLRGYDIEAVLCFKEDYYENWKYLEKAFQQQDPRIRFAALPLPPNKLQGMSVQEDELQMLQYYERVAQKEETMPSLNEYLKQRHANRLEELESAAGKARNLAWWPFQQHAHVKADKDVTVIDSAYRDHFYTLDHQAKPKQALIQHTFDGSASWWTQCLGHARTELTLAAAHASGRYGHVIFPQAIHEPALQLADRMVTDVGEGWASKAFFSDDGSTGMEVGIKMALRAFSKRNNIPSEERSQLGVLGLKGSYHGDTIGAMDAAEASVYSRSVEWHKGRGFWFDPPYVQMKNGQAVVNTLEGEVVFRHGLSDIYDVESRLASELAAQYKRRILKTLKEIQQQPNPMTFAALILEPIVMGAGGMIFVDPLFQRVLVDTVRSEDGAKVLRRPSAPVLHGNQHSWSNLPVVYDEVFSGLHRVGPRSGSRLLGCTPDVACYAKILTGGLVPMAITLATQDIYETFLGDQKLEALLHGHSYTAYPIGCAVANKTLELLDGLQWKQEKADWNPKAPSEHWSLWRRESVEAISQSLGVEGAMAMGTVLSIQLTVGQGTTSGYQSSVAAALLARVQEKLAAEGHFGLHARTLGDVFYVMSALDTPTDTLRALEQAIIASLQEPL